MQGKVDPLPETPPPEPAIATPSASEGPGARWNTVRYAPASDAGHVESYFLKLNDPAGERALWLKATITVPVAGNGAKLAEAWAIAFDRERGHLAARDTTELALARFGPRGLDASVCKLHLSPGRAEGSVGEGPRRVDFDLRFTMDAPPLCPFPSERMYEGRLPSFKLVSPHPDSRFSGTYRARGETIAVRDWRGMQGHNWGARHTERYAWAHVNQWEGEPELLFEGFTGRTRLGPLLAPPVTILCVRHRGVRYDFNGPLELARARGQTRDLRAWSFRARSALAEVSGELFASTADLVGLRYDNPEGEPTFCLNSKLARGRLRLSIEGRPHLDVITRAAALEIGTKNPKHGVSMLA